MCATIVENGHSNVIHKVRYANGSWTPWGNVEVAAGERGEFLAVACTHALDSVVGETGLQLVGVTQDGKLWHTLRNSSTGAWTPFGDVEGQAGQQGPFVDVDATCSPWGASFVVATNSGTALQAYRATNGSWTQFLDLNYWAQVPVPVKFVGAGLYAGNDNYAFSAGTYGTVYHTEHTQYFWTPAGNAQAASGFSTSGENFFIEGVSPNGLPFAGCLGGVP